MLSKFLASYAHFSRLILFVFHAHEGTLNSGAYQPRFIEPMYAGAVRQLPDNVLGLGRGVVTTKPVTTREWLSNCKRKPARHLLTVPDVSDITAAFFKKNRVTKDRIFLLSTSTSYWLAMTSGFGRSWIPFLNEDGRSSERRREL